MLPSRSVLRRAAPWLILLGMILIGAVRIVSTYGVFSQTFDEPAHLASGIEYLQSGTYTLAPDHTPLPRTAIALAPFLAGARLQPGTDLFAIGTAILNTGDYDRNLALARLGVLPFFALCSVLVVLWTQRVFGMTAALAATLLFTTMPPVLAHAGIATTDMVFTACFFGAVFGLSQWLEKPTPSRAVLTGLGIAGAVAAKYSVVVFLPACVVALLFLFAGTGDAIKGVGKARWTTAGIGVAVALLAVWAAYRFSFGPVPGENFLKNIPVPAPEWFRGLFLTREHMRDGHPSYLLGDIRMFGWWYFFPVVLAVKTPLAFLALTGCGIAGMLRAPKQARHWQRLVPLYCAGALLMVCLNSSINLGVRHILPIYPFLCVVAGAGVAALLESRRRFAAAACVVLLAWQISSSAIAHPDYLSYFNELAARRPERVLAESDLDWGQDIKRLSAAARRLGISEMWISCFGTADLNRSGLPNWKPLDVYQPVTGWVAISAERLMLQSRASQLMTGRPEGGYDWLKAYRPVANAGKSIFIYYIPPPSPPAI